jgi:hypothetical protein
MRLHPFINTSGFNKYWIHIILDRNRRPCYITRCDGWIIDFHSPANYPPCPPIIIHLTLTNKKTQLIIQLLSRAETDFKQKYTLIAFSRGSGVDAPCIWGDHALMGGHWGDHALVGNRSGAETEPPMGRSCFGGDGH